MNKQKFAHGPSTHGLCKRETWGAEVSEGEEVMTSKIPRGKGRPLLREEDWVVSCQAPFQSIEEEEWRETHEKLQSRESWKEGLAEGCCSG